MTQDEIIQMAVECGIIPWTKHEYIGDKKFTATDEGLDGDIASLVQFFQMATTHEREACAKVCEDLKPFGPELALQKATAEDCAAAIRARGDK